MNCDHPADKVTADILEGDSRRHAVKWCRICGAYRRVFKNTTIPNSDLIDALGEWRLPEMEIFRTAPATAKEET